MEPNWVNALDNLASGGVIDFDAAAFLLDKPARFVGHPDREGLPLGNITYLPDGAKLKDLPKIDTYEKNKDVEYVHNPTWKKVLVGAVVGGGILGLGLSILSKFVKMPFKMPKVLSMPKIKFSKLKMPKFTNGKLKTPNFADMGDKIKDFVTKIVKYAKKPISFVASKLKNIRK